MVRSWQFPPAPLARSVPELPWALWDQAPCCPLPQDLSAPWVRSRPGDLLPPGDPSALLRPPGRWGLVSCCPRLQVRWAPGVLLVPWDLSAPVPCWQPRWDPLPPGGR